MNAVKLEIGNSLPGSLSLKLTREGSAWVEVETAEGFTLEQLATDLDSLEQLLPLSLSRELQQWAHDDTSPTSPGLLAIVSEDPHLDGIPWEFLPQLFQLPSVSVVRLLGDSDSEPNGTEHDQLSLLAAGWSGSPFVNLPGIQKELNGLSQLGVEADVKVRVLSEPSPLEFVDAYTSMKPRFLHLIAPAIRSDAGMPEILLSGGDDVEWIRIDNLLSQLQSDHHTRLVVFNTCSSAKGDNGPSATRVITKNLGGICVGWIGDVNDLAAVDFALFLYTRLFEGSTAIDALRSYRTLQPSRMNLERATRTFRPPKSWHRGFEPIPVVWTSSLDLLYDSLLEPATQEDRRDILRGSTRMSETPAKLDMPAYVPGSAAHAEEFVSPKVEVVEFEPQAWLNPALLKNGRSAIVQLALNPDRALRDVSLAITCDTGAGTSTVRQTMSLENGRQPVPVDAFEFPILYQLIQSNVPRRQINFTLTCCLGETLLAEETKSALWMGRAEWLDKPDTWHFIPAFVDPNADGVLDVIDGAVPVLKTLVDPIAAFEGYLSGDRIFVMQQVEAIFSCLRDAFHMNYISPPPLLVYTPGDYTSSGQRVRSPNDVIERKRGTCHDLAILFASCMEHVGIYPLVFLIRGHTFVGFWNDSNAHREYWDDVRNAIERQSQGSGREWTIANVNVIKQLLKTDSISCLEATEVTDRNAGFAKAANEGKEKILDPESQFDIAIDIQASRHQIQPL